MLQRYLENERETNDPFASDLYDLFAAKGLRGFHGFSEFPMPVIHLPKINLWYSPESSHFRGDFLGFDAALGELQILNELPRMIYWKRYYFHRWLRREVDQISEDGIFWRPS